MFVKRVKWRSGWMGWWVAEVSRKTGGKVEGGQEDGKA